MSRSLSLNLRENPPERSRNFGAVGTFEATCIAVLRALGVPLEAALTATLLLRGLMLWAPTAPGLWLARRELSPKAPAGAEFK